jgi:hypothetical protein
MHLLHLFDTRNKIDILDVLINHVVIVHIM